MKDIYIKKYLLFTLIILLISFICGIIYYYNFDSVIKSNILESININNISINNTLKHLIILVILFISSFLVIGSTLSIFYLYFEGLSIGFTTSVLINKYGTKGILYTIIYNTYSSILYIILLIILLYKFIRISKNIIYILFTKNNYLYKVDLINKVKSSSILIVIIFLVDLVIYFFSKPFLNLISGIL